MFFLYCCNEWDSIGLLKWQRLPNPASFCSAQFALFSWIFWENFHQHPHGCWTHVLGIFHVYTAWWHQYLLSSPSRSKLEIPIFSMAFSILVNHTWWGWYKWFNSKLFYFREQMRLWHSLSPWLIFRQLFFLAFHVTKYMS